MKEVKERPMLFSGPMVRAILDGRKTQTRRVVKGGPFYPGIEKFEFTLHPFAPSTFRGTPAEGVRVAPEKKVWVAIDFCDNEIGILGDCPYGVPGDRLFVKEDWYLHPAMMDDADFYIYRANPPHWASRVEWKPAKTMPSEASRIIIEVTNVRVERLQDISEDDARAEGIRVLPMQDVSDPSAWWQSAPGTHQARTAQGAFCLLWDSIAKSGQTWDDNSWVWVIEFRRVEE